MASCPVLRSLMSPLMVLISARMARKWSRMISCGSVLIFFFLCFSNIPQLPAYPENPPLPSPEGNALLPPRRCRESSALPVIERVQALRLHPCHVANAGVAEGHLSGPGRVARRAWPLEPCATGGPARAVARISRREGQRPLALERTE